MNKKKKKLIILISIIILAIGAGVGIYAYTQSAKQILKNINPSNTKSVYVQTGELKPYELSDEEKETFFELLLKLDVYQKDKSESIPTGTNFSTYIIEKNSGQRIAIKPTDSRIYIDEKGYWLKRDSYEASSELEDLMTNLRDEHIWKDMFE